LTPLGASLGHRDGRLQAPLARRLVVAVAPPLPVPVVVVVVVVVGLRHRLVLALVPVDLVALAPPVATPLALAPALWLLPVAQAVTQAATEAAAAAAAAAETFAAAAIVDVAPATLAALAALTALAVIRARAEPTPETALGRAAAILLALASLAVPCVDKCPEGGGQRDNGERAAELIAEHSKHLWR
jgi:hypothetical protein